MIVLEQLKSRMVTARRALVKLTTEEENIFDLIDASREARIALSLTIKRRIELHASRLMPGFLQRVSRLVRDDKSIEDELTVFLFQTQAELERIVRASHVSAMRLGYSHVRRELEELGLPAPRQPDFSAESDYLRSVLADIRGNVHAFRTQAQTLTARVRLLPKEERMSEMRIGIWALHRNLILRTTQGSSVVVTRAAADASMHAYETIDELADLTAYKIWVANFVGNDPCPACAELHGSEELLGHEFDRSIPLAHGLRIYHDFQGPPMHPNCLPNFVRVSVPGSWHYSSSVVVPRQEKTRLSAENSSSDSTAYVNSGLITAPTITETVRNFGRENIRAVSSRNYVGKFIVIKTASGNELTATPNHPIATRDGWVPIAELKVGDYVLSSLDSQRWSSGPDINNIPPTIEEVAKSFSMVFRGVPVSSEDFHGDGTDSDVCVIYTDSFLGDDFSSKSSSAQKINQFNFILRSIGLSNFVTLCARFFVFSRTTRSAYCIMRRLSPILTLFGRSFSHSNRHGFALIPDMDVSGDELFSNDLPADSKGFCDRLFSLSSDITLDKVIDFRIAEENLSQVYNLETNSGWYVANGIVTHNCQCNLSIVIHHANGETTGIDPQGLRDFTD